jgi:hypothetical protein
MLMVAFIVAAAGSYLLGNALLWRVRAKRMSGTLIGVRQRGQGWYCPVYRYTDETGRTIEATTKSASSTLTDKQTGSSRPLLILANQPEIVREATSNYFVAIAGVAFVVFGLMMASPGGWLVAGLGIAVGTLLSRSTFNKRAGSATDNGPAGLERAAARPPVGPVQRAEDIIITGAGRNLLRGGPMMIVIGLVMFAVACFSGRTTARLEISGQYARGNVVDVVSGSGLRGSISYVPVVRFTTSSGILVKFQDSVGNNPPEYGVGDEVQVIYIADGSGGPSVSAIVDRGLGNWLLPFGFAAGGVVLAALGVRRTASARAMKRARSIS